MQRKSQRGKWKRQVAFAKNKNSNGGRQAVFLKASSSHPRAARQSYFTPCTCCCARRTVAIKNNWTLAARCTLGQLWQLDACSKPKKKTSCSCCFVGQKLRLTVQEGAGSRNTFYFIHCIGSWDCDSDWETTKNARKNGLKQNARQSHKTCAAHVISISIVIVMVFLCDCTCSGYLWSLEWVCNTLYSANNHFCFAFTVLMSKKQCSMSSQKNP